MALMVAFALGFAAGVATTNAAFFLAVGRTLGYGPLWRRA